MGAPAVRSVEVAHLVATAAQKVPDVLGLHGGALGEVATYGQGGPVQGVRVWRAPAPRVQLRLIVRFGARLDEVAEAVRERVAAAVAEDFPAFEAARVDVRIVDVRELAGDSTALPGASGGPASDDATAQPPPTSPAQRP